MRSTLGVEGLGTIVEHCGTNIEISGRWSTHLSVIACAIPDPNIHVLATRLYDGKHHMTATGIKTPLVGETHRSGVGISAKKPFAAVQCVERGETSSTLTNAVFATQIMHSPGSSRAGTLYPRFERDVSSNRVM